MVIKENRCVGCPDGMFCMGSTCPMVNVSVSYCDHCGGYSSIESDGEDFCEECFEKLLDKIFDENIASGELDESTLSEDWDAMNINEKVKMLDIDCQWY